jgi:diguanylate cyclase (GGDEF)-like protein
MRIFSEKSRRLGWLSAVLVIGFLATSMANYVVSRDALLNRLAGQVLPLTADHIYLELQKDLLQPVFISSQIAQDTLVRDWMAGSETNPEQMVRALQEIGQKYGVAASFVASERTRQIYHGDGTLKPVLETEPDDKWFFRLRDSKMPYETRVAPGNGGATTIFIHHRILDNKGNFIGATGVGLTLDALARLLDDYRTRFRRSAYFVDAQGVVVALDKPAKQARISIRERLGIRQIAPNILNSGKPAQLEYRLDGGTILVSSRFIPELGWHLVVEQNATDETAAVQRIFWLNLAIAATVILLTLVIVLFTFNRYQRRLERLASTDSLTGLMNRQAFEIVFRQSMLDFERTGRPLSVILFDIDMFKQVNDTYGYVTGDRVLCTVAQLIRDAVRENDIITRWGDKEFLILLRDCNLESSAKLADKLRGVIAEHNFGLSDSTDQITVSVGVAQHELLEPENRFFARADQARYEAKATGRNRTTVSIMEGQGEHATEIVSKRI